jgi:mono/diheme cytochrome c family protein
MKSWYIIIGLLVAVSLAFLVFAAEKGDAAKGKELFNGRCVTCHGSSGEGKEAIAKAFNVKMRPLGSKEVQSQDDAAMKKIILEGKEKMKPNALSDVEANNVVAFLRSLKK